jgi:hypothetical protein
MSDWHGQTPIYIFVISTDFFLFIVVAYSLSYRHTDVPCSRAAVGFVRGLNVYKIISFKLNAIRFVCLFTGENATMHIKLTT